MCLSENTLDRLRQIGLPSIQIPRTKKVLFDIEEVVSWLKEQSETSTDTDTLERATKKADDIFGKV